MSNKVMSLAAYKCTEVQRSALSGVVLPRTTRSYQPIGHDWLLLLLQTGLHNIGLKFGNEHHGLSHDGMRYFGLIELLTDTQADGYSLLVGIRNSLDKTFAAQLAFGNSVMVCANLSFFGQYMLGRKHTTNIKKDMPMLIERTLEHIPGLQKIQDNRFSAYKETPLSGRNADHLVMDMYRSGAITTSRIGKVIDEWDEPTFDHGDRTVWRMFNAATQAMKGLNIQTIPHNTMRLQTVCDDAAQFKVAA